MASLKLLMLILFLVHSSECTSPALERTLVEEILANYSKIDLPRNLKSEKEPIFVEIALVIHGFSAISVINMDYTLNLEIHQRWIDPRFIRPETNSTLKLTHLKEKVWTPDTYFTNSKDGKLHTTPEPQLLLQVNSSNGMVYYKSKVSLKLSCHMNLYHFPMDVQYCYLNIGSYSYDKNDVKLRWWLPNKQYKDYTFHENQVTDFTKAIRMVNNLEMNEFARPEATCCTCTADKRIDNYPCLIGIFKLERKFGFYLTYVYFPSMLVLFVCWLSFFIDSSSPPARVSICVFSILSVISQGSFVVNTLPKVSYPKAIDIWIFICFLLVIIAFFEYVLVNYGNKTKKTTSRFSISWIMSIKSKNIERFFRLCYPLMVIILNITYWTYYLNSKKFHKADCIELYKNITFN